VKKRCPKCRKEKLATLEYFSPLRKNKDGLSGWCKSCNAATTKAYKLINYEKAKTATKAWQFANPEKQKLACKNWRNANPGKAVELNKTWLEAHPGISRARTNKRRAVKLQAIPKWFNEQKVLEIYKEAARLTKETRVQHVVDHQVPLQSKLVCGLHWHGNLQILKGSENSSKGNRHWPDMS
jgi:5-methylcytosine-specific restriction endonuclease McrA